jgi:hypothetical protein
VTVCRFNDIEQFPTGLALKDVAHLIAKRYWLETDNRIERLRLRQKVSDLYD